jgi:hypothetical protein
MSALPKVKFDMWLDLPLLQLFFNWIVWLAAAAAAKVKKETKNNMTEWKMLEEMNYSDRWYEG